MYRISRNARKKVLFFFWGCLGPQNGLLRFLARNFRKIKIEFEVIPIEMIYSGNESWDHSKQFAIFTCLTSIRICEVIKGILKNFSLEDQNWPRKIIITFDRGLQMRQSIAEISAERILNN